MFLFSDVKFIYLKTLFYIVILVILLDLKDRILFSEPSIVM